MAASSFNLKVELGATFRQKITWSDKNSVPINLTGYTGRMQVRKKIDDPIALIDLTTENGGIVLGGTLGTIEIVITDLQTADLSNGVYDLELIGPQPQVGRADVYRILYGTVEVKKNVTRNA